MGMQPVFGLMFCGHFSKFLIIFEQGALQLAVEILNNF